jgi:integrase
VQQWIKGMEATLAASTIKVVAGWASSVFNAAVDDGIVVRNPFAAKSVRRPKVARRKVVPWDLPTVNAVADALGERCATMVYVGAGCAHRQGELFGIALDDVDFLGRIIHVERRVREVNGQLVYSLPKGGKQRSVTLPESVGLRLSAHIAEQGTTAVTLPWGTPEGEPATAELLFTAPGGRPWRRNAFGRLWVTARTESGMTNTRDNGMHVLRHTAASAWLAHGVDINTVAEYLGHTDPGFTLRTYTHLMPDAADRARKAMDAFFRGEISQPSALDVPSGA